MPRFPLHTAVAGLIVALGCTVGELPPDAESAPVIEQVGTDAIQEVGTSEAIGRIADVVEGADGTIWILNSAEPYLIAMATDGSVLRSWGTKGGGPSEFLSPGALVAETESGHVWVYDNGHHALMRADGPDGAAVESILIPRDSIPVGRIVSTENAGFGEGGRAWIRSTDAGFLLVVGGEGSSPFARLWNADLRLLKPDGTSQLAYSVASRLGDPTTRFGQEATEFLPYPLWALCPDGVVTFYDPLGNTAHRLSPDDTLLDSVPLPPERDLEVTIERVFHMAWSMMREQPPAGIRLDSTVMLNQLKLAWNEIQTHAAAVFPEYADLECTSQGTLWLQPFDPDGGTMGRGPVWLRIDSDGNRRQFRFPDAFRPLRFQSGRVLGSLRGELDIESVAWLTLPGA